MRDDPHVVALVTRASEGDHNAWNELVDRYASLVYTICTRCRLSNHDIEDVGQNLWLLLVEQLGKLREPAAFARLAGDDDHRTRMPARRDGGG